MEKRRHQTFPFFAEFISCLACGDTNTWKILLIEAEQIINLDFH